MILSDHPSRDELSALSRGGLSTERERAVMRHLLRPCGQCLAAAPLPLRLLLGLEPVQRELTAEEDAAYDAAIGRAIGTALKHERHLRGQRTQARKALTVLEEGGSMAAQKLSRASGNLARMQAFLDRSWQIRHQDPRQMVELAWFAAQISLKLDARQYGPAQVFDFQARAHAELGNAYRVSDRLHEAGEALGQARRFFECGTREEALEVRLLELEASLAADRRQFGRASIALLKVLKFYSRNRDSHFAGRTLILMGLYAGYGGDFEKGIRLLQRGLTLADGKRDPGLLCAAAHNLLLFLVDIGRFQEAKKLRLVHSRYLVDARGRVNEIKFRALEGRIDAGLGNHVRAEGIFREVRHDFDEVGRHFHAAIAALHLAASLLVQGKAEEAVQVVLEAAETFTQLKIQREALQAVILLRNAFEMQAATRTMVEEVASFLRRIEIDPALRFEGRAWEEDPDE
jgi:tetratricopeptide (TPR) repeat protein